LVLCLCTVRRWLKSFGGDAFGVPMETLAYFFHIIKFYLESEVSKVKENTVSSFFAEKLTCLALAPRVEEDDRVFGCGDNPELGLYSGGCYNYIYFSDMDIQQCLISHSIQQLLYFCKILFSNICISACIS
jgi:hypothetical protein